VSGLKISGFQHTGVHDFGNPEDKELGHFGVGNSEVPKEASGPREKWNFAILADRHFGCQEIEE
jgi:hypothetical protein